MDIDCCRNVRVSNCTVNSPVGRRHLPQKLLRPRLRARHGKRHHHQLLRHRVLAARHAARRHLEEVCARRRTCPRTGRIKFGTESNGGFKNITISNCVFEGCQGLALETVDGALLEDVTITNITMRDIVSAPIFLRLGARLRGPKADDQGRCAAARHHQQHRLLEHRIEALLRSSAAFPATTIEDITITTSSSSRQGGGTADQAAIQPPENEAKYPEPNMFGAMPASGFYVRHLQGLSMSNVQIRTLADDARPAIVLHEVKDVEFFRIKAQSGRRRARHSAGAGREFRHPLQRAHRRYDAASGRIRIAAEIRERVRFERRTLTLPTAESSDRADYFPLARSPRHRPVR